MCKRMELLNKQVKQKLFNLAEEKYRKFHSGLCPNSDNILGVRVPVLRNYAKELINQYSVEELLKTIDEQFYEETMLKGMIIGLSSAQLTSKKKEKNTESWSCIKKQIQNYIPKITNWALCDVFCAGLKITKKNKSEMWSLIQEYLKSNKEFELRFAIVMILDYYIDDEYLAQDFEIFNSVHHDGYYVKMAVAWAVSMCFVKYYDETVKWIIKSNLDNFTYNKSIQKSIESYRITKVQKNFLRGLKKFS